jgi:hypothetical protein
MTSATAQPSRAPSGRAKLEAIWPHRGWRGYVVLVALLAPLCVPYGPGQSALLDFVNLPALALFGLFVLSGRRFRTPFFFPVLLIAVGSGLATIGAPSMTKAVLSVAQDIYLFSWFLMLVNVMSSERDVRAVRIAWMWTAVAVSFVALGQVFLHSGSLGGLLGARGLRPAATLYNSNMLADYLVVSLFIAVSLWKDVRRRWLVPVIGTLLIGLIATKSNGGLISLGVGLVVWAVLRAISSRMAIKPLLATLVFIAGLVGIAWWMNAEFRFGDEQLASIRRHTFASRMEHSAESRGRIRETLERTYARSPLGIGPGNSGALTVGIAERERRDSYQSKEAHSDYLAYAIERGPLGLVGLIVMMVMGFAHVAGYWRYSPHRGVRSRHASRWTAAMAAALTASAVHSLVIEKLHFRHYWLLLAMVCASSYAAQRHAARRHERVSEAVPSGIEAIGLPPHIPGRTSGALVAAAPPTRPALPAPPARTRPALARRYRTAGAQDSSGGVVS